EDAWGGDEQDRDALDQLGERRVDARELEPRGPGADGAEEEPGDGRSRGGAAADQRDRDAVEAVAGAEDARILVLGAEDEKGAGEAGQRARERHRFADPAARGYAAGVRGLRARADRAPLESAPCSGEQEPDRGGDRERDREAEVEPAARNQPRQPG